MSVPGPPEPARYLRYLVETLRFGSLEPYAGRRRVAVQADLAALDRGRVDPPDRRFLAACSGLPRPAGAPLGGPGGPVMVAVFSGPPGRPGSVPLVGVPGWITPDGALTGLPGRLPVFDRRQFCDSARGRPATGGADLGDAAALDRALVRAEAPWGRAWTPHWRLAQAVFDAAVGRPGALRARASGPEAVRVTPLSVGDGVLGVIEDLYREILKQGTDGRSALRALGEPPDHVGGAGPGAWLRRLAAVFRRVLTRPGGRPEPGRPGVHRGHMSAEHGLDPHQRGALMRVLAAPAGGVQAVEGPPGTGKTSLMRGLVATEVVRRALLADGADPWPVVATGPTNRAALNLLDAFQSGAPPWDDAVPSVGARWIDGVPGVGWFYPSAAAADKPEYATYLHLRKVRDRNGGPWRLRMGGAAATLGETVASGGVGRLEPVFLERFRRCFPGVRADGLPAARAHLRKRLGSALTRLERLEKTAGRPRKARLLEAAALLPPGARERWTAGFEAGLAGRPCPDGADPDGCVLGRFVARRGMDPVAGVEAVQRLLDRTLRRRAFQLALRIGEARWLEAEASGSATTFAAVVRRCAWLAPVVVATPFKLPDLFRVGNETRLGAAPLLVFDEAGQASPALGIGLLALARRAVVLGDEAQLSPIVGVSGPDDRVLAFRAGLRLDAVPPRWRVSEGSVMGVATDLSRGGPARLLRHYRCRPGIAAFFNHLAYGGRLEAVRGSAPADGLPEMGFRPCKGAPEQGPAGSRLNHAEADAVASWLEIHAAYLVHAFPRPDGSPSPLADVVAVLTPYRAQKALLAQRLGQIRWRLPEGCSPRDKPLTVGTVHALQGAEIPVVLFSAVSGAGRPRPFIDASPEILNVAVSRARESFVLFGNPDLFGPGRDGDAPSARLARHLAAVGRRPYPRRAVVVESPVKAGAVQAAVGGAAVVVATGGHFRRVDRVDLARGTVRWRPVRDGRGRCPGLERAMSLRETVAEWVIATDDDAEGDAIGWHWLDAAAPGSAAVTRMVFHDLEPGTLAAAYHGRTAWKDFSRARAALTRAVIDRELGRLASQAVAGLPGGKTGFGRVQSANLHWLASREAAGWGVRATIRTAGGTVAAWVARDGRVRRFSRSGAEAVAARLTGGAATFGGSTWSLGARIPEPVSTHRVLVEAWKRLGIEPTRTMAVLQDLYVGRHRRASGE